MHDWMHVRGTYSLEKPGGLEGGPSFRRGVIAPPYQGVLPPSASLPAAVGLNDPLSSHSAQTRRDFARFSRETWSVALSLIKIGEI
jgi:hypothetical protein